MQAISIDVKCSGRKDRLEVFIFGDCHIGKRNCDENAIKKQVTEIIKRSKMPNRHVRVLMGGDLINAITPSDVRRFDFNELADWFTSGDSETTNERLSDMTMQEINKVVELFAPISEYVIGAIVGNHENMMRKRQYLNVHKMICERLGIRDLTDEAMVRIVFKRSVGSVSRMNIYLRHGYGSGRSAGAEPNKLATMLAEWEDADVCLTGHTHTFCIAAPKPVVYIPTGKIPTRLPVRHRFAANWGCWLLSHLIGVGSYESSACYPARPMMTVKVVVWPFWHYMIGGKDVSSPKIELREYAIL